MRVMEDSSSSREGSGATKPMILKLGVALVLSATGLIFAKFLTRKDDYEVTSSTINQESCSQEETETEEQHQDQEIFSLKTQFEELQSKEYEMELRFERYCKLKDQEVMLMERKNMLSVEKSQLDYFRREVSAMEEEHKRSKDLVKVYLKLVGEIEGLRLENGLLCGKVKKFRRRTKQLYGVVNEKNWRIFGVEKEFLRSIEELEIKNKVVKELECEVEDLKAAIDVLQEEKESLKANSEMVKVEDYKRVIEEYEELKKDYAEGVKEMINLSRRNACLRHEVMRNGNNYEENVYSPDVDDEQEDVVADDHHHHEHHHHESSRRKRLMKKLKKWVEGNEKGKPKSEEKCFGRHSLTVEPQEDGIVHSRRSCSSV